MKYHSLLTILLTTRALAAPTVQPTLWREIPAYELSDGRSAAVVVPKLGGRIVSYGLREGTNFIWTDLPGAEKQSVTLGWGGDKTYIGPHSHWRYEHPTMWPPPAPDAAAHDVEVLLDGALRTTSPPWEGYGGARITREYRFAADGALMITHTISKVPGSSQIVAVWDITQTIPTPHVFVPLNPVSPYREHFYWFDFAKSKSAHGAKVHSTTLLEINPVSGQGFKLGAHPAQPALATIKDSVAFVQSSRPQDGQYPEGVEGAGLCVEVYHHGATGTGEYVELELLSPLRRLEHGATLTTRWELIPLPPNWTAAAVEKLLTAKFPEPPAGP